MSATLVFMTLYAGAVSVFDSKYFKGSNQEIVKGSDRCLTKLLYLFKEKDIEVRTKGKKCIQVNNR